ncbi:MAG: cell division protein FtsZ [Bacteroidales bacterium]|nr:cell division protein FtsZ [Bacteroidales bacterium]MDZ4204615.1 cell division protein FtsZ [Bacteroidales bacterium]
MPHLKFDLPKNQSSIIKVLGIGGGGSNAVSHMFKQGIKDVDFLVCNTDAQALDRSPVPTKLQLGLSGLGAGNIPDVGREATLENIDEIKELLKVNTQLLFITAGMGGGTGTGGAPVVAKAAHEMNILTVGIVTMPFSFEGRKRRQQAEAGIEEMRKYVDTLLVINNDKLRELYGNLKLSEAFGMADDVLSTASRGIAEIITVPGYVNVDFEDVKTVMKNSGKAILGSGKAEGPDRASNAVKEALASPLLDDNNISGASNILLYLTSGKEEISMDEVSEITDYIQQEAGQRAEIIWGNGTDESLGNMVCVTVIATGFNSKNRENDKPEKILIGSLADEPTTSVNTPNILPGANRPMKPQPEAPTLLQPDPEKPRTIDLDLGQPNPTTPEHNEQKPDESISAAARFTSEPVSASQNKELFVSMRKCTDFPVNANPDDNNSLNEQLSAERKQRLRELSQKYKTPAGLAELEKEPAFVRRSVELNDPPFLNNSQVSRYMLINDDDNNTDLRTNNSFLHDNVD